MTRYATPELMASFDNSLGLPLLASSPDCVKLIDPSGRIRFMNENGLRLIELDGFAEIDGALWVEMWPESVRADVQGALDHALSGQIGRFSAPAKTRKGSEKWWDVAISPVRNAQGELIWLLAVSRDITRQKQNEDAVRISEQRFRALADNMAQFAWLADASGYIYWYNQRWFDYTGTTLDEMRGWGWQSVHHPEHIERVSRKYKSCLERGNLWEDTFPLRGADGTYRWFLSRAVPMRDDNDNVILWCGTNTDITEHRNASLRIRQLARIIELSHEAILVWSMEDGIVLWNRGCEELYGYKQAEALGKSSHELLQTNHSVPYDEFDAALKTEGAWTGEIRQIANDGSEVWVDSRQELIRVGGSTIVLETNRDITDRRIADETRNLLMGELNHRVKNTLAVVQSIASQTARTSRDVAQFVERFNGRLHALSCSHNVLTHANWTGASLQELVDAQLQIVSPDCLRVTASGPDIFLPPQAALQLTLILHELATNAAKHGALSNPWGRVTINWAHHNDDASKVRLSWREIGGPPVTVPTAAGFGLTLIERTGRSPQIKSELTFDPLGLQCDLDIDLNDVTQREADYFNPGRRLMNRRARMQTPATTEARSVPRILIIEDEPMIGMEIDEILSASGFSPLGPFVSVDAALDAIATLSFDAAVLDGNLFGLPVDQVVAALEARNIPFVFVSGFSRENLPEFGSDVPHIMKPIRGSELTSALRRVLSRSDSKFSTSTTP